MATSKKLFLRDYNDDKSGVLDDDESEKVPSSDL